MLHWPKMFVQVYITSYRKTQTSFLTSPVHPFCLILKENPGEQGMQNSREGHLVQLALVGLLMAQMASCSCRIDMHDSKVPGWES